MNVESLEFWQKVKEEYKPFTRAYICHTSKTFRDAWEVRLNYYKIFYLASEFIETYKIDGVNVSKHELFVTKKTIKRKIRGSFIDYCIAKYSAL